MELDALNYVWGKRYDVVCSMDADDFLEYKNKYGPFKNDDIFLGFLIGQKMPNNISQYIIKLGPTYKTIWHCKYISDNKFVGKTKELCESNERLININSYQSWTYSLSKPYTPHNKTNDKYTKWYNKYMNKWFGKYSNTSYEEMTTDEA